MKIGETIQTCTMQTENKTESKIICRIVDVICAGNSNVRRACTGEVNEQLRHLTTTGHEARTISVYSRLMHSIEDAVLGDESEDEVS